MLYISLLKRKKQLVWSQSGCVFIGFRLEKKKKNTANENTLNE